MAIYSSSNLREWMLESRFGPAHATEGIWECPDIFPLQVEGDACVLEVYVDGGLTTFTELVFPHAPLTQVEVRTP